MLKTDLWNEAKNTEILGSAAEQGARPVGFDIAYDLVRQATAVFGNQRFSFLNSDVRQLPFGANKFDLLYSMGTIEHFPEYPLAASELYRVLKPNGTAIIGVPNKLDPFGTRFYRCRFFSPAVRPGSKGVRHRCALSRYDQELFARPGS